VARVFFLFFGGRLLVAFFFHDFAAKPLRSCFCC
jgi:hypothetical protein